MPPAFPPTVDSTARRERILALATSLRAEVETLDLQEIDGEFYWRICRDDLLEPLRQIAASCAPRSDKGRLAIHEVVADLHEHGELSLSFFKRASAHIDALPSHVWSYLATGERIPLRPTRILFLPADALRLRIVSRSFSGERLELALARYGAQPRRDLAPVLADQTSLHVDFALVREPPAPESPMGEEPDIFPYIDVTIARPLPPRGIIGPVYDAIVRQQRQWHLELPGGETVQDKEVAIRTWAIGLLMNERLSFGRALRVLESRWGDLYLGQEADRQARNRLMTRVPEVRLYLRPR
jgi:hypothetical protein